MFVRGYEESKGKRRKRGTYDAKDKPSKVHGLLTTQSIRDQLKKTNSDELTGGEHSSPNSHMSVVELFATSGHLADKPLVGHNGARNCNL